MAIVQDWWPVTQITNLPPAILLQPKYQEGEYSFKCAKVRYFPNTMFISDVVIDFYMIDAEGKRLMGMYLYHHWKKVSDDLFDPEWKLVGYST